ncbi:MAG: hypothetical protein HHJ12_02300 [Glaciimonas sp.]|nr:hypothetical protein [Glaciimonas sp.]
MSLLILQVLIIVESNIHVRQEKKGNGVAGTKTKIQARLPYISIIN